MNMSPSQERTWRFSVARLLLFVSFTSAALSLAVSFSELSVIWGLGWFFASVAILRGGSGADTLLLLALGLVVAVILLLLLACVFHPA